MASALSFDRFLELWRQNIPIDSPEFTCADVVFHELHYYKQSIKTRQKIGLASWLLWWLKQTSYILTFKSKTTSFPINKDYCFTYLPTPAHTQSLAPIFDEIAVPQKVLLGNQPLSGNTDSYQFPESAPGVLSAIRILLSVFQILIRVDIIMLSLQGRKLSFREKGRIAERVYSCLNAIQWVRKTLKKPLVLFVTYELPPLHKALVYCNTRIHGRSIHVMHGQRLDLYQFSNATDIVLFSKIDEPWFRSRVNPSVRIWTIGHPRLELIRKQVGPANAHNPMRKPRITFFSQSFDSDYPKEQRIIDFKILAGLRGHAEVRLRAHPSETYAMLLDVQQEAQLDFASISDRGLVEDLKWCDAAASSLSTVSMEAAACGRGVFWTCQNPKPYQASQELRNNGIGVLLKEPNDWMPYLEQWKTQGWGSPVRVDESQLRELGMIGEMNKPWTERLGIRLEEFAGIPA